AFQWNGEGQAPSGLVEGIADYTILVANYYYPRGFANPGDGDRWHQGYDISVRFLEYYDGIIPQFVAKLNKMMRYSFNVNYFEELTGKPVDQLWGEYIWKGDITLRDKFPRIFALEMDKTITVAAKMASLVDSSFRRPVRGGIEHVQFNELRSYIDSVTLSNSHDRWICNMSGDGIFRVKDIRNSIDDLMLPSWLEPTKWVKYVPIKINIFEWRARRDCFPTRVNLIRRGVYMEFSNCPICGLYVEDTHHVLFQYDLAQSVLRRICRWWDLDWQTWSSFSTWDAWFSSIRLAPNNKKLLEGVFYVAWWSIWVFQNCLLFDDKAPARSMIVDDIMSLTFLWCKNRCKWALSWEAWLKNPHLISL
ncbi:RNA-directed DNA polymerase, eukaryota, partial [Tanacetum coccineum]